MEKILWVKFGWSDYYRGGPVDGNFGWLKEAKGGSREGKGHEAFNFLPIRTTYYCYVPPQAKLYAPSNADSVGWTVVCLAKNPKQKGVHIVGWYEDATLLGEWLQPPNQASFIDQGGATSAYEWSYCIKSKSAFFVPPENRVMPFSDPSVRQGKYSFLSGPSVHTTPAKVRVLRLLKRRLADLRLNAIHNPSAKRAPDPELNTADPLLGFGTPEHRKRVEKAAERAVIKFYEQQGFSFKNMTKIKCGYDFRFTKSRTVLDIEVKGTSSDNPGFFLTRNEHDAGYKANPSWRLALVTRALSDTPELQIYTAKELRKAFDLSPYVFLARPIAHPD